MTNRIGRLVVTWFIGGWILAGMSLAAFSPASAVAADTAAAAADTAAAAAEAESLDPNVAEAEQQRIEAISRAMPATVSVFVPGGAGGGSGVLISPDGYALTNFHVSSPAGAHMRCGLSDGNIYDAVIVGIDPVGDLALIRLLGRDDFPTATFADSRLAEPGDWCMAIGNPFLLSTNLQPSVSFGILSGVGRYQYPSGTLLEYGDCLQTDAAINPGNSGGPLFDANGDLLGIIGRASFEKRGRVNVGVGYAISIRQAENFLGYLHSGRIVDHATLGATVSSDPDRGVVVSNILESSDAYRRGLRYGTEILEIDGRPVETANEVQNVLATLPRDWRVKVTYRKDGETVRTLVRLAGVHRRDELLAKMAAALPPPPPRQTPPQRPDDGEQEPGDGEREPEPNGESPGAGNAAQEELPEEVRRHYVAREGFANYHVNLAHQNRFIAALRAQAPDPIASGEGAPDNEEGADSDEATPRRWQIEGVTDDDRELPVTIRLAPATLALSVGEDSIEVEGRSDLYTAVEEGSLAGILPPLDAWRRMLARGPQRFGETTYQGTVPLQGERPLRDCTSALDGDMEVRWLQHPSDGRVEVVEVFASGDTDPAELWLHRSDPDPALAPSGLELRYGTTSMLKVRVESWKVSDASPEEDDPGATPADEADGAADDVNDSSGAEGTREGVQ